MTKKVKALFWFKRDLRIEDNAGFYHALKECDLVAPIFIFDKNILEKLPKNDKRINFIWNSLKELKNELQKLNSDIIVKYADPKIALPLLAKQFKVDFVYTNEDYEPYSIKQEALVKKELNKYGIELKSYKDHVIFAKDEIVSSKLSEPYKNFSYYKSAWLKKITEEDYQPYTEINFYHKLCKFKINEFVTLEEMGFEIKNNNNFIYGSVGAKNLFDKFTLKTLKNYSSLRNIPYVSGVSYLSTHLRYGTISIRCIISYVFNALKSANESKKASILMWLESFIWREFYFQLFFNHTYLLNIPLKEKYKNFKWENDFTLLQKWCEAKTGFPIIDAAMNQLNKTGYMHNRLRLIVASFLTKDLLIDYKFGEAYFAYKLLDYEQASNIGNWQWVSSMGTDRGQQIRFFNPSKQSEIFDPEGRFIKKYLPIFKNVPTKFLHEPWKYQKELSSFGITLGKEYPLPIVNHEERKKIAYSKYSEIENLH